MRKIVANPYPGGLQDLGRIAAESIGNNRVGYDQDGRKLKDAREPIGSKRRKPAPIRLRQRPIRFKAADQIIEDVIDLRERPSAEEPDFRGLGIADDNRGRSANKYIRADLLNGAFPPTAAPYRYEIGQWATEVEFDRWIDRP